jgi:chorismate mutase
MLEEISEENLEKSIKLISEFTLDEEDYNEIYERVRDVLKNSNIKEKLREVSEQNQDIEDDDLPSVIKKIMKDLDIIELNNLLKEIMKNDEFMDFIQDLLIEKLLQ